MKNSFIEFPIEECRTTNSLNRSNLNTRIDFSGWSSRPVDSSDITKHGKPSSPQCHPCFYKGNRYFILSQLPALESLSSLPENTPSLHSSSLLSPSVRSSPILPIGQAESPLLSNQKELQRHTLNSIRNKAQENLNMGYVYVPETKSQISDNMTGIRLQETNQTSRNQNNRQQTAENRINTLSALSCVNVDTTTASCTMLSKHNNDDQDNLNMGCSDPFSNGVVNIPTHESQLSGTSSTTHTSSKNRPPHTYVALISMAILDSAEKKLLVCDIYQFIMDKFPYYNTQRKTWRNTIRHNLSLHECFIKNGLSRHCYYWSIHPACIDDFSKGEFYRRQTRANKCVMGFDDFPKLCRYSGAQEEPAQKLMTPVYTCPSFTNVPETNYFSQPNETITQSVSPLPSALCAVPTKTPMICQIDSRTATAAFAFNKDRDSFYKVSYRKIKTAGLLDKLQPQRQPQFQPQIQPYSVHAPLQPWDYPPPPLLRVIT